MRACIPKDIIMIFDLTLRTNYLWTEQKRPVPRREIPAFNLTLCQNFRVKPLEFDGIHDSLFHEFDERGNRHMEYVTDHGTYSDVPFDLLFTAYRRYYPKILALNTNRDSAAFTQEAAVENR